MKSLLICFLLGMVSTYAQNSSRPDRLTVMSVSEGSDIWSIRLNENVDQKNNPLAFDVEVICDYEGGYEEIRFTETDGIFYGFHSSPECDGIQKKIEKNSRNGKKTCLRVEKDESENVEHLIIDDESACE